MKFQGKGARKRRRIAPHGSSSTSAGARAVSIARRRVPIPAVRCLSRILSAVASWSPRLQSAPPQHEQFVQFGLKAESTGENRRGYEAGDRHPHKNRERQPVRGGNPPGTTISTQPSPAEICRSTRENFFLTEPRISAPRSSHPVNAQKSPGTTAYG